jgi:hypothetical protein
MPEGHRIVVIEWQTSIIPPLLSGKERGGGWISHKLIVKLRVFGDPRYSGDYTTRITYPHCSIEEMQIVQEGQLSLPISELALLPPCTNPVVVKYKPRNTKALRQAIQQSLPLFDASAKLHFIATEKGYPTLSLANPTSWNNRTLGLKPKQNHQSSGCHS